MSLHTSESHVAALRMGGEGGLSVSRLATFLHDLDVAYCGVLLFDSLFTEPLSDAHASGRVVAVAQSVARWESLSLTFDDARLLRAVSPNQRLHLGAVRLASPGFWEFLGALNPLQAVREYLNDRHRRRQDRDYRERAEEVRLALENEALRVEVLRRRLDLAADRGVPPEVVAEAG